ncbi:uncharacterized protein PITG_05814 [Phytophthora infestans T30-4]|uniref:FHA domain-containing protein n=1 Tax=Phytophthora infestans (strain T30-4) TaxID=403677 RepID=D0N5R2_PHYIT|nr:uncharacterized protein PITG_05814 [Phytophthora infestans T30-4]EEY70403.1 conserved hypothetical protein [Phytophthora infestans T30-4]|eukprot:XP_002998057.1 conserved hypothetical protein [Phytophthora infestans T30-4]
MAQYSPPKWGESGRNEFGIFLEVIKGGMVVEILQLPRSDGSSYVVAGRMETVCDLALAHPSISRTHAALQFDEQGALFLYDIHSTHGCFVNKKRVQADVYVRLHIGDVLGFGESTRLYAVCGPPELLPAEYESLNLAKFREKLEKKREKKQEENGASWGFGEDAEEEESDEEDEPAKDQAELPDYLRNLKEEDQPYRSSVSQSQVNEKDQKLYQQLQTRIRKMENLKLEKSRILAKQNQLEGLSEGQQRTLERNDQRIEALVKEIDGLEARIHAKNDQRIKTGSASRSSVRKKRNISEELYGYNSDEDDFYDRTKANQQKIAARKQKPQSEVLTADSIQANETDSLDSFMAETTTQLHVSEVDMLTKRKGEIEAKLQRQRQLLAVATPAIAALPIQKPAIKTKSAAPDSAPAPLQAPQKTLEKEVPAPKRRRISGPAMGPPQQMKSKNGEQHDGDASVLEGGDQVWVPPTNQSGDGRTKLNDKYGY